MTSCLGSRLALPHIRLENAMCGCRFILNTEKKISIIENTRIRVDDQIQFKNATCGRRSFLNMEGKISVFESIRLGVNKTLLIFTQICACVTNNLWNVLDYQTRHENVQSLRTNFGQVFFSVQRRFQVFLRDVSPKFTLTVS